MLGTEEEGHFFGEEEIQFFPCRDSQTFTYYEEFPLNLLKDFSKLSGQVLFSLNIFSGCKNEFQAPPSYLASNCSLCSPSTTARTSPSQE